MQCFPGFLDVCTSDAGSQWHSKLTFNSCTLMTLGYSSEHSIRCHRATTPQNCDRLCANMAYGFGELEAAGFLLLRMIWRSERAKRAINDSPCDKKAIWDKLKLILSWHWEN
jgi:hypothetical protein